MTKDHIIITHFINPTLFWFKYQNADCATLLSHEKALQTYANSLDCDGHHQPVCEEVVLVKHLEMDKWVRCVVDEISIDEISGVPEYTVWIIDYGQPLRTQAKWILPLDAELALFEIRRIYKAGLANIVPAAAVYNLVKSETEFAKTENWSEYVVTTIDKILTKNDIVYFTPEFEINAQFFGNLEVLMCGGKAIELRDVILSIQHGCVTYNHQEFLQDLNIRRTTNFRRFESQVRQSSFAAKKNKTYDSVNILASDELAKLPTNDKPSDDNSPSHMACVNSMEHRKMLDNNNKQPDVAQTNPVIRNYLDRLRNRSVVNKPPGQFHLPANLSSEPHASNVNSSSSSDESRQSFLEPNVNALPKYHDFRFSESRTSSTSEEPAESSSGNSRILRRSALSMARSRFCPPNQSKKVSQMDEKCLTNRQNQYSVLVHSLQKHAEPIDRVADAYFTDSVHEGIKQMCISSAYRTQSVAWPHIMRGNSMVLINNSASGRTMSFLPAICSLVQEECIDRLVPDGVGPIAVILCVSSVKVVEVAGICRKLLNGSSADVQVVEGFGERHIKRIVPLLFNGCGIFVCTVPNVHRLLNIEAELKKQLFCRRRIVHLVLDDIDLIVGRFSSELKVVMESFCRLDSNGKTDVQTVVTSRVWLPKWQRFFKFGMNPMLCIGNFIEAAVYARSELRLKLIASAQKIDHVLAVIRERNYMQNRTIVVCNISEEVLELVSRLKDLAITPAYCHNESSLVDISAAESWNLEAPPGQNTVLVCTDDKLIELNIKSAQNIIHYSLPSDWTRFSLRFSAMSDNFENFVVDEKANRASPFSLVLLDENNNQQLARLIDFMLEHDVTGINEEILQVAQKIRRDIEETRRINLVSFCPDILLLGECDNIACKYRHCLTYSDRSKDDLPRNGRIKMEILHCHSPCHYSVRILEHIRPGASHWTPVNREYLTFSMKFQNYYVVAENHRVHIPVVMGDLCVLPPQSRSDSSYHRCEVIRVDLKLKKVSVRLIDVGISLHAIYCADLLKLTAEFADFTPQAVDVRIADLIPYDYEAKWDRESMANVTRWLEKGCTEKMYFDGTIQWSGCLNTIWVDTIRLNEKLCTPTVIFVLSVRSNLLSKKFGIVDDRCLIALRQMAASCGIHDELPQVNPKVIVPTPINPNRGRRIPSKLSGTPSSAKSLYNLRQSTSSELNTSSSVSNSNGVSNDRWVELQPRVSQTVDIPTFITPWRFYVQILSPELYKLFDCIDEFTAEESNRPQIHEDLTIGMMCLGKAYGEYNRAKVTAIECNLERGIAATVFFVDNGKTSTLLMNELLTIPKHLVEKQPFQAILCSLIGIQPTNNNSHWDLASCNRIYNEIIKPCTNMAIHSVRCRNEPQSDLDSRTYECILVDMDDADHSTLNDRLVSCGLADYEPLDRKHLTLNIKPAVNTRILKSDVNSDKPESWDNEHHQNTPKCDAVSETHSFEEDGVRNFEHNFTDAEILDVMRSLLNVPLNSEELLEMNTSESAAITEITDNIGELDNEARPQKSIEQRELLEITDPIELYYRNIQIPALKQPASVPNVKWQQNNTTILLVIEAPDVGDYYLQVTAKSMQYSCIVGEVPQFLHMHLLGCIDTEYTSHEVRGLSVYVRLIKTSRGPQAIWPRLMATDDRHRWLKYNTEAISLYEKPKNQFTKISKNMPASLDSDDSDSQSDTELQNDHDNADPEFD